MQSKKKKKLVDLQHELHADSVLYQPHHQVGLALEHLVVLPGQRVRVLDGEVKVWGWTKGRERVSQGVIQWQPLHLELGVYVLVLLFASTEGWVQQNSSDLQLVLHDLVQLLEGSFQGYRHHFVFDEVDFTTSRPWCELRLGLGTEL